MYKIAVIGDYDSIYGFATLGLSICPVKTREDARKKLKQLADGQYGKQLKARRGSSVFETKPEMGICSDCKSRR